MTTFLLFLYGGPYFQISRFPGRQGVQHFEVVKIFNIPRTRDFKISYVSSFRVVNNFNIARLRRCPGFLDLYFSRCQAFKTLKPSRSSRNRGCQDSQDSKSSRFPDFLCFEIVGMSIISTLQDYLDVQAS